MLNLGVLGPLGRLRGGNRRSGSRFRRGLRGCRSRCGQGRGLRSRGRLRNGVRRLSRSLCQRRGQSLGRRHVVHRRDSHLRGWSCRRGFGHRRGRLGGIARRPQQVARITFAQLVGRRSCDVADDRLHVRSPSVAGLVEHPGQRTVRDGIRTRRGRCEVRRRSHGRAALKPIGAGHRQRRVHSRKQRSTRHGAGLSSLLRCVGVLRLQTVRLETAGRDRRQRLGRDLRRGGRLVLSPEVGPGRRRAVHLVEREVARQIADGGLLGFLPPHALLQ